MKSRIFWDITLCSLYIVYTVRHSGPSHHLTNLIYLHRNPYMFQSLKRPYEGAQQVTQSFTVLKVYPIELVNYIYDYSENENYSGC
jgi:hypothetical protein